MSEVEKPAQEKPSLSRRERYKRSLAINAFFGFDGASHCHDIPSNPPAIISEPNEGEDFYIVSLDIGTGELSFKPGDTK
ncbi:MAG: hypothetical protein ABIR46_00830 [Candidatus Saccharimonadales bacterium]